MTSTANTLAPVDGLRNSHFTGEQKTAKVRLLHNEEAVEFHPIIVSKRW